MRVVKMFCQDAPYQIPAKFRKLEFPKEATCGGYNIGNSQEFKFLRSFVSSNFLK